MLKRLLATTVALGFLGCGATVVLEAVGVLFHVGVADPEQRADAFLARLEADLNTPDLPTEPVEIGSLAEQERPGQETERVAAVEAAEEERHKVAYVQDRPRQSEPEDEHVPVAAKDVPGPLTEAVAQPEADRSPLPGEAREPGRDAGEGAAPVRVAATVPPARRIGVDCTGACAAKPVALHPGPAATQRPARPHRSRYAGASTTGGGALGCPVLDWLDAVMAPLLTSAGSRASADRRAAL